MEGRVAQSTISELTQLEAALFARCDQSRCSDTLRAVRASIPGWREAKYREQARSDKVFIAILTTIGSILAGVVGGIVGGAATAFFDRRRLKSAASA